ncbi:hypothetical protein [Pontibacter anaerobius]|uniref:Uncharacterized protein n=1 Tax=Pontibacter anaerobius TaxID=2993940 RepID=A0ABT3RHR1_9BACT|nr:hypothetical protein [Pontibacter anaerobius]MCX2740902.1 hypothetical protein [Pontibacter anaerobius]
MKNQNWNTQNLHNTRLLAIWTFAWVASMALATFGPTFIWQENMPLTLLAIAINAAFGVAMILANIRHIKGLDEMQRKIQLEAMGIALGVGVVGGLSYTLLDTTNVISGDAEISFLVILIGLTYLGATIIGQMRYR